MKILSKIFSGGFVEKTNSIADLIDRTFTSDEERLKYSSLMTEAYLREGKENAKSRFWWVSGARPFLMLVSGVNFLLMGIGITLLNSDIPEWYANISVTVFLGSLGLNGLLRTAGKFSGKTK